ncbi:hypothetical protein HOLleu_34918 [Holothuria leucospilota]|uniref:arylamine N-acetyltransferase n=1 Tax=Holothuria leucospilota TaxID=206669 RepID=A0A9Q0YRA4_HOLLE|nr:hypothetical protein HOLleu_34918 [Holothuria leucospilota]
MALSKEEATLFLRDVLQVPDTLFSEEQPSLPFLNGVIKSYQNVVPWQSVISCAIPHSQRHLPTWEEIKQRQFAKQGGRCYENNMFIKEVLNAFSFDVCYISCQVWDADDHMTVMVRGLTASSSRHWVDVGSSFPLFQAIPFDFQANFVEYDIGFLRQRFVKTNGIIEWHHSRHHPPNDGCNMTEDGNWYIFAKIKANVPCDLDTLKYRMTIRYTVQEESMFLQKAEAVVFKDYKLVAMKGMTLVLETPNKTLERKKMENFQEALQAYKTFFPQIPTTIVRAALSNTVVTKNETL